MLNVKRFADDPIRDQFPLKVTSPVTWSKNASNIWETSIRLPDVPADSIIVPSYSSLGPANKYQFSFRGLSQLDLYPVPSNADFTPSKETDEVSGHIDCWHTKKLISNGQVILQVGQQMEPSNYLITVSFRDLVSRSYRKTTSKNCKTSSPIGLSQMSADKSIRDRICSPTALAMALSLNNESTKWSEIIEECYDPATKAFGSWPLAIRSAAHRGFIGSVEANEDWSNALDVLQTGQPLVCSIRFKSNGLTGAPLTHTSGHLVCVYGVEENAVLTLDPAEKNEKKIRKRYDLEEFSKAWLEQRGAAYYFHQIT